MEALQVCLIDSKALKTGLTNFLLAYNLRAGVAFLLKFVRTLLRRPKDALSFEKLLGEGNLAFRVEAVRMGLFLGGFTGLYRAVAHGLAVYATKSIRKQWHSAFAGWIAGLSLYFMDRSWHRTLALYMSARMAQLAYNFAKARGYWHFWGSDWAYGDSLLFIISSAQVMYAYVMRPETLPPSYYKFIVRQGPIAETMLQAVRDNCRDKPINLPAVMDYISTNGGEEAIKATKAYLSTDMPKLVPSRALHPYTSSKLLHTFNAFKGTARQIFPVYLTLALIPSVVLRFKNFVREPTGVVARSVKSAIRSTAFLAVFCSGYQGIICLQRSLLEARGMKDHKLWYYFAGIISSLSILIERKSRRSELALYAFPRAADSLYMILYDHRLAFRVPQGEVLLFCCAMSAVMWSYENDETYLSPLVVKLLDRFLPRHGLRRSAVRSEGSESLGSADDADFDGEDTDGTSSVMSSRHDMPRDRSVLSLNGSYTMAP
ncbi:Transmembrane protein 135 [Hondaea fermentalgiana]|uniref:Transmembrane protein 135 n=1 Tax=Hondaea fermentalgiana TaxID=2315210 RepID=A0A2R5G141_9STRA|nr:Transmembrane protein 135 [Hondaea fermentalgiana]|eukprot:GBG24712.1 Transmembrane protein 135 [Hondaea fermentalgiana]